MSSTYTGVGGNVSQSTSPTITVPSDGDSLAVTSVNTAMDKLMDYIALIWGGAFTGQATGTPGLAGTGGATAQGVKATAGGGGSPAKGALNLVPQAAPSAPADGDIWIETTTNLPKARINGVTYQITPVAYGGLFYNANATTSVTALTFGTWTTLSGTGIWDTVPTAVGITATASAGTLVVTNAGTYRITFGGYGNFSVASSAVNFRVWKNGATAVTFGYFLQGSSGSLAFGTSFGHSFIAVLAASDSLVLQVTPGSSGNLWLQGNAYFQIERMS